MTSRRSSYRSIWRVLACRSQDSSTYSTDAHLALTDDPQEVADAFVAEHKLPDSYRERIRDFVAQFQPN